MQKDAPLMFHQIKAPAIEVKRKYAAPSPPRVILSAQPGSARSRSALLPAKG
ncbi:hypothetical protein [Hyphomonas sp.]|uniref:hypothetical protein n=1 Tax=Hyphomonas sp. TaxID=87 RepID=UPI0025C7101B|nr:hypothetical protein [Hyphomonas sp.]